MSVDPFDVLGLAPSATADEVRAARRDLARRHHPDAGGDADAMRRVNVAATDALEIIARPLRDAPSNDTEAATTPASHANAEWFGTTRDVPSFTVDALPVETFEALLLAAAELGEVEDDDPPYELRTLLGAPIACWCQLDIVPDAGASTVSIAIAALDDQPLPRLIDVRNAWITALNSLDWSAL